jgi:ATP-dependent 26S proteasome regulatory subunit
MLADFHQFLIAKDQYDALGIAWRRGAILMGPPGNGKTHFLRTLVQQLKIPCLYVQCLDHPYYTSEQLLDLVFDRARQLRPALLIFEDLDSLINEENRSFFLNQLDGFEKNTGLIVVATTNHPERIDSAILDRPSRFDRKYEFGLPSQSERQRFLYLWRDKLSKLVPWNGDAIPQLVEGSADFSYAYLKELMVSSLLRWLHGNSNPATRPPFEQVLSEQCELLQLQRMPPNDV